MYDERGRHNYNSQCTHFSDSQAFEGHNTYSPNKSCFKMGLTMYYVPGIEILVCCHFSCQAHIFFNLSALSCYYVGHAPTPTPQFINPTRFSYDSSCQTQTTFLVQSTSLQSGLQSQAHCVHELVLQLDSQAWGRFCSYDVSKSSPSTSLAKTTVTPISHCFFPWNIFVQMHNIR